MSIHRDDLQHWLGQLLACDRYSDYCPNGLQLQGQTQVRHIVTGVTASLALIKAAIERGADTLLVHHGWFWKNEDPCIVGMKHQRIAQEIGRASCRERVKLLRHQRAGET